MRKVFLLWFLSLILLSALPLTAQNRSSDSLDLKAPTAGNEVYKPVLGIGYGGFSFLGDVRDPKWNILSGNPGVRFTVSTYLNKIHSFKLDFNLLLGSLSANEGATRNHLNFSTDLTSFGVAVHYSISRLYNPDANLTPFVSFGVETFRFNSKGDLLDPDGHPYVYAEDGTIRNDMGDLISQDFVYETDLRSKNLYGLGSYSQVGFGFPVELGFEGHLSKRVVFRVGTSLHITTTDLIDNVNSASGLSGTNRMPDMFTFSYVTLHLDLFSGSDKTAEESLFQDTGTGDVLKDDEDGDQVPDLYDQCPFTPSGVVVDTLGCPVDSDGDGVPDYLDREPNTPPGHYVTEDGRLLPDSTLANMLDFQMAVKRSERNYYLENQLPKLTPEAGRNVPLKFKEFDQNNDDYISLAELLAAIDKYFDYRTFLSLQDIYEFIEFYFSQ